MIISFHGGRKLCQITNSVKLALPVAAIFILFAGCEKSDPSATISKIKCSDNIASPAAGQTKCTTGSGITFAFIPNGSFEMGSGSGDTLAFDNEKPRRAVNIAQSFFMGVTEVTQGQWKAITNQNNPSYNKAGNNYPVEQVSYNNILEFIAALNAKEPNIIINNTQYKYDLPTAAQWEYAARGGVNADQSWWFGTNAQELEKHAWYSYNSDYESHAVGQLLPNPYGLYDIYGNVKEWVKYEDPNGDCNTPSSNYTNATNLSCKQFIRFIKGGSFYSDAKNARSAFHDFSAATDWSHLGFRLVLVQK